MEDNMKVIAFVVCMCAEILLGCLAVGLLIAFPKLKAKTLLMASLAAGVVVNIYFFASRLFMAAAHDFFVDWFPISQEVGILGLALTVAYVFALRPSQGVTTPFKEVLFSFRGRIGRQTYWIVSAVLFLVGAYITAILIEPALAGYRQVTSPPEVTAVAYLLWVPVSVWITLATQVKRWHDRNKSGWMVLVILIPIAGPLWVLVEQGFLKGASGPNRYGEDPFGATMPVDRGNDRVEGKEKAP
jgi:uncharacterized membrane protein YhaH (DUF805 family)